MSYWREINTYEQLNSLVHNGIITESFWVTNTNVNKLIGVKEIRIGKSGIVHFQNLIDIGELISIDCDFSFWGNIHTFKRLEFVGGTLRYGAPISSLGVLKEVGGDLRPTTNELEDLGELEFVGGTADFRGMVHLNNLGKLKHVGDNLNLVKSLKGVYELKNINVKGRVIYWNKDPKYYKQDYLINDVIAPAWEYLDPYSFEKYLVRPDANQMTFYKYFRKNFFSGIYVNVGGMRNYIRYFIYEQLAEYKKHKNFENLVEIFQTLIKYYPELSHDAEKIEIELGRELGIQKYLDFVHYHEKYLKWEEFLREIIQKTPHIPDVKNDFKADDDLFTILKIGFKNENLTDFGQKNIESILTQLIRSIRKVESKEKEPFARRFFDKGKFHKSVNQDGSFSPNYYRIFFESEEAFNEQLLLHNQRSAGIPEQNLLNPNYFPTIAVFAIESYFKELVRESENFIRIARGLPQVGEGWISETNLFYRIKTHFPEFTVVHQGKPKWLGMQRFDIYFPKENIAIEYQGNQHFEAIDFFGGEEGLKQAIENDKIKKEKCIKNGCILIEVLPDYDFYDVVNSIRKAININTKSKE